MPHLEPIQVRWGDMDSMGHVNNAVYFTYCESARMSYFEAVRLSEHRQGGRFGPALAAANLNFRRQVRYPEDLEVVTRVSAIGRSSFTMEYEIRRREGGERVAEGAGVVVWVDYEEGRSLPLPEELKESIRRYEGIAGAGEMTPAG
jgi:acyl-CoA thioester hydrolase